LKEALGTYGVGVQKHIRRGWDTFSKFVWFEVGMGSKVRFWHDIWCDDRPLEQVFPSFITARYKDDGVADNFQWIDGIIEWNVIFM
jgi:hypothetical protein